MLKRTGHSYIHTHNSAGRLHNSAPEIRRLTVRIRVISHCIGKWEAHTLLDLHQNTDIKLSAVLGSDEVVGRPRLRGSEIFEWDFSNSVVNKLKTPSVRLTGSHLFLKNLKKQSNERQCCSLKCLWQLTFSAQTNQPHSGSTGVSPCSLDILIYL